MINFHKKRKLIWDAHACPTLDINSDISILDDYHKHGYSFVSLNAGFEPQSFAYIVNTLKYLRNEIINNKNYLLVKSLDEIETARSKNKLAISFDIEGSAPLEKNLERIDILYNLGVRQFSINYNTSNSAGGGCSDLDKGLSLLGYQFIKKFNKLGIIVDCSHVGEKTSLDIIKSSSDPVVFSHSNPKGLWDHERNISDEQIKACASSGGVIGINGISIFLKNEDISVHNFVDHIDYIVDIAGVDHVGLGFDFVFEHIKTLELVKQHPEKFPNREQYFRIKMVSPLNIFDIYSELKCRNYKDTDIDNILGGNFYRIAKQVWK